MPADQKEERPKITNLHDEMYAKLQSEHISAVGNIFKGFINELKEEDEVSRVSLDLTFMLIHLPFIAAAKTTSFHSRISCIRNRPDQAG